MKAYLQRLDAIVTACLSSNPDLLQRLGARKEKLSDLGDQIRLFDVKWLLMTDFSDQRSKANIEALECWWNIKRDALSSQSDECIGFVYDALRHLSR